MEIINNNNPKGQSNTSPTNTSRDNFLYRNIYIGVALIAAGMLWLLRNLDVIDYRLFSVIFSWQMLLMVIGGYLLTLRKMVAGSIVFAVGALFALGEWFDLPLPVRDVILPLAVVALGIFYIFQKR